MSDDKKKVCLKLENVSKVFAKVESDGVTHALQDVSTEMQSGECPWSARPAAENPQYCALLRGL